MCKPRQTATTERQAAYNALIAAMPTIHGPIPDGEYDAESLGDMIDAAESLGAFDEPEPEITQKNLHTVGHGHVRASDLIGALAWGQVRRQGPNGQTS